MSVDVADAASRTGLPFAALLLSKSAILMVAKISAAGVGFITYWLLAQVLTPDAFGTVLTLLSFAAVAGTVATLGYPSMMARFDKRYETRGDRNARAVFAQTAYRHALVCGVFVMGIIIITAPFLAPGWAPVVTIVAGITPAITLLRVNGALAIANRRPLLGYLPDMVGRPLIFMIGLLLIMVGQHILPATITLDTVAWAALAAAWTVCAIQAVAIKPLRDHIRSGDRASIPPHHARRLRKIWLTAALPLVPSMLMVALFPDLVLLASATALSSSDLAILGICLKIAFLVGFVIQATIQIALPDLARSITDRDTYSLWTQLRSLVVLNATGIIVATLIAAVFSSEILGLFGQHYTAGASLLVMLCALQLVRLPAALAIQVLILRGRSRKMLLTMAATLATLVAAIPMLADVAGLQGIALAICIGFLVMSMLSIRFAMHKSVTNLADRSARVRPEPAP